LKGHDGAARPRTDRADQIHTTSAVLKPIGLWIETLTDEDFPAPQELVGELPNETRAALVQYLATGLPLIHYRGYSWCRFACGIEHSRMGSWDLTDGVWVWPQGLSHYVDVHGISLPEEFVSHALSGPARTKPKEGQEYDFRRGYDFDYWLRWCAARRSPAIIAGLRTALVTAQAQVSADRAARVDALERKHGLSGAKCTWTGVDPIRYTGRTLSITVTCAPPPLGRVSSFPWLHRRAVSRGCGRSLSG